MSRIIPYYDVDRHLTNMLSPSEAENYVRLGVARPVRSKGEIVRLYRLPKDRMFANAQQAIGQMRACSNTTRRMTNSAGVIISPPKIVEHR